MAPETFTRESFWAELDGLGEEEVRTRVSVGTYSSANKKRELAQQWLERNSQERSERSNSEQMRIARSAKNAAWAAAIAATIAAICATISIVISLS